MRGPPAARTPRAGSSRSRRRSTRRRSPGRTRGTRCRAAQRASCCARSRAPGAGASPSPRHRRRLAGAGRAEERLPAVPRAERLGQLADRPRLVAGRAIGRRDAKIGHAVERSNGPNGCSVAAKPIRPRLAGRPTVRACTELDHERCCRALRCSQGLRPPPSALAGSVVGTPAAAESEREVAYVRRTVSGGGDIYATTADGRRTRRITRSYRREQDLAVSPDGAWIAFTMRDPGTTGGSSARASGSAGGRRRPPESTHERRSDHDPAWADDGRTLLSARPRTPA